MRIMAFASQKGGSGKTTLAGHIAVQAERAGAGPVAMIDADPQGSLSEWWNDRRAETPIFAQTFISRLNEDLRKMRDLGIELLIFDTPPAITATIEQVVRVCDLVVIPTRPSPHDLRAAGRHGGHCRKPRQDPGLRCQRRDTARKHHRGSRHCPVATRHGRPGHDPSPD